MPQRNSTYADRGIKNSELDVSTSSNDESPKQLAMPKRQQQQSSCCSLNGLIKMALLAPLIMILVNIHAAIDERIDGKWRDYPPFSFIEHPPLEAYLDADELARNYGFELHDHWPVTRDGYILKLVRLTAQNDTSEKQKPVVILQHGLADSSDAWILNGRKKSLGFILSDAGYDVWMTNSRGNKHNEANHTTLTHEKDGIQLWSNMLTHDMAVYDMPANIEYVKNVTGVDKVSYIGHSQGSQQLLYNLIKNRTFVEQHINYISLLSPYLALNEVAPLSTLIVATAKVLRPVAEYFNYFRFLAPEHAWFFLPGNTYIPRVAAWFQTLIVQENDLAVDADTFKRYLGFYPGSASIYNWINVGDMMAAGVLHDRDFGSAVANIAAYGTAEPPVLDLAEVNKSSLPIYFVVAVHDLLVKAKFSRQARETIKDRLIDYTEIAGGHNIFFVAKTVSPWAERILAHLAVYNKPNA